MFSKDPLMNIAYIMAGITVVILLLQVIVFNYSAIKNFKISSIKKINIKDIILAVGCCVLTVAAVFGVDIITDWGKEYSVEHPRIVFSILIIGLTVAMIFFVKEKIKDYKMIYKDKIDIKGLFTDKIFLCAGFAYVDLVIMAIYMMFAM